ncbi:UTP--glucose-1-phosphate uridylyltransferase, partial [Fusobacterium necrophorum BFTR-2]
YPVSKQLIDCYEKYGSSVVGCQAVAKEDVSKYGIVKAGEYYDSTSCEIKNFIEKPTLEEAPSTLASLGRYCLSGKIFQYLEKAKPGKNGEIQLTDSILSMIQAGEKVLAYSFSGKRYDIGDKFGLLKANIEYGLRHEEIQQELREYLSCLLTNL